MPNYFLPILYHVPWLAGHSGLRVHISSVYIIISPSMYDCGTVPVLQARKIPVYFPRECEIPLSP